MAYGPFHISHTQLENFGTKSKVTQRTGVSEEKRIWKEFQEWFKKYGKESILKSEEKNNRTKL